MDNFCPLIQKYHGYIFIKIKKMVYAFEILLYKDFFNITIFAYLLIETLSKVEKLFQADSGGTNNTSTSSALQSFINTV